MITSASWIEGEPLQLAVSAAHDGTTVRLGEASGVGEGAGDGVGLGLGESLGEGLGDGLNEIGLLVVEADGLACPTPAAEPQPESIATASRAAPLIKA